MPIQYLLLVPRRVCLKHSLLSYCCLLPAWTVNVFSNFEECNKTARSQVYHWGNEQTSYGSWKLFSCTLPLPLPNCCVLTTYSRQTASFQIDLNVLISKDIYSFARICFPCKLLILHHLTSTVLQHQPELSEATNGYIEGDYEKN